MVYFKDSFQEYVKVINSLPPVIILGVDSKSDKVVVELLVVNSSELDQIDLKLSFFDEQITINAVELSPNQVFQKSIPGSWTLLS